MKNPTPEQIKQTRIDARLTVTATAKIMGTSRKTVHCWENGTHPMKPRDFEYMLMKLAKKR